MIYSPIQAIEYAHPNQEFIKLYQSLSVSDLGVFGVIVIFAESIWVASRSISTVLFAKQLEEIGERIGFQRAQKFALYSF